MVFFFPKKITCNPSKVWPCPQLPITVKTLDYDLVAMEDEVSKKTENLLCFFWLNKPT